MKILASLMVLGITSMLLSCGYNGYRSKAKKDGKTVNVLFLHHSTGGRVFDGAMTNGVPDVVSWFNQYNVEAEQPINVVAQPFPRSKHLRVIPGYGWNNYPYDYYNIWVKNSYEKAYKYEPTLDNLTQHWDVIVFKHCYPVSKMVENSVADINSDVKSAENYQLQYLALKQKMLEYPQTKFIVWTGAALPASWTNPETAQRVFDFFQWVKNEWDAPNDNIFVWDFYHLETEGDIYMNPANAVNSESPYPSTAFAAKVAPLLCQRIVDVVKNNGTKTDLLGRALAEPTDTTGVIQ